MRESARRAEELRREDRESSRASRPWRGACLVVGVIATVAGAPSPATAQEFAGRVAFELTGTFSPTPPVQFALWQNGTVVLEAFRTGGTNGLWVEGGPGGLTTILEDGQDAPGLPGLTLATGPAGEWVSRDGSSLITAFLDGPGVTPANWLGTWLCSPGCALVYRSGDDFPPLPDVQLTYGPISPRLNRFGQVAFYATLAGSGAPLGTRRAFVAGTPGGLLVVAREGSPAPGRLGEVFVGSMFDSVQLGLAFNDSGRIAFKGSTASGFGIWSGPPGSVQPVAFEGEAAFQTGEVFTRLDATSVQATSQVMVVGDTAGDRVFTDVPGLSRLAAASLMTTDDGDSIGTIWRPAVNPHGRVAFISDSFTEQLVVADQLDTPGLATIAKTGEQAPGLPAGVVFDEFLREPVINQNHQVAFEAGLAGAGVDPTNDRSLWIADPGWGLVPIAREGSMIQLGVADQRTLVTIESSFADAETARDTRSISDGGNLAFNDRGEVVYRADFADGSSAVVVGRLVPSALVFEDGFESGDTTAW